jgi:hypothetical protein
MFIVLCTFFVFTIGFLFIGGVFRKHSNETHSTEHSREPVRLNSINISKTIVQYSKPSKIDQNNVIET